MISVFLGEIPSFRDMAEGFRGSERTENLISGPFENVSAEIHITYVKFARVNGGGGIVSVESNLEVAGFVIEKGVVTSTHEVFHFLENRVTAIFCPRAGADGT